MMKHSFVVVFSIFTCIVYGQLPGNRDPYRPSVAQSPSAQSESANSRIEGLYFTGEQPQLQNEFLLAKIEFLQMTVNDLASQLRLSRMKTEFLIRKQRETNEKVTLMDKKYTSTTQAMEEMINEWAETKPILTNMQHDLRRTNETLKQTEIGLVETTLSLETVKTDLLGTTEAVAQIRNEFGETKSSLETVKTDFQGTKDILKQITTALEEKQLSIDTVTTDLQNVTDSLQQVIKESTAPPSWMGVVITDLQATKAVLTHTKNELEEQRLSIETVKKDLKDFSADATSRLVMLEEKIDEFTATNTTEVATNIDRIPTSCDDLKLIGHTKSGLYSVLGSNKVRTVYCDFTTPAGTPVLQKLIGYQDVKSNPVYFYVQKNHSHSATFVPIPYERTIINIGGAMDAPSGRFTAPVKGTYFFSFTGLAQFSASFWSPGQYVNVLIYRNGQAVAHRQLNIGLVNGIANSNKLSPLIVQSTLTLQAGDKVWVQSDVVNGGDILDHGEFRCTHFNGWLLEEEIVA